MAITINGTTGIAGVDGSASTPAVQGTDTNTGIFFPAADTIAFGEGGAEVMRINSSGNVGIGTTSPGSKLDVRGVSSFGDQTNGVVYITTPSSTEGRIGAGGRTSVTAMNLTFYTSDSGANYERARITSGGDLCVGKTATGWAAGSALFASGTVEGVISNGVAGKFGRGNSDGTIIEFRQDDVIEGTISVSGTTVSYNGGNLSRWAQMPGTKDNTLVKGTVMSNLDEMNVYTDAEGNPVDNEQLNKVKVSDVEGDVNVAGVFVNWTYDEDHQVDEINMAMTGDMIIRIAQGVVVQKGDLLMSAGDGTAKPQGDDIVRSKTVAKVTSNHVTCTYADGSYCVPCVLMAC
jgi:hypothetical protein